MGRMKEGRRAAGTCLGRGFMTLMVDWGGKDEIQWLELFEQGGDLSIRCHNGSAKTAVVLYQIQGQGWAFSSSKNVFHPRPGIP